MVAARRLFSRGPALSWLWVPRRVRGCRGIKDPKQFPRLSSQIVWWSIHSTAEDSMPRRDVAEFEFALWRDQTWHALRALRTNDGLTTNGRRFVAGMAARMDAWQAEPR